MITVNVKTKQTLMGKLLLKSKFYKALYMFGLMDYDTIRALLLKTYRYKAGKGKWHRFKRRDS